MIATRLADLPLAGSARLRDGRLVTGLLFCNVALVSAGGGGIIGTSLMEVRRIETRREH